MQSTANDVPTVSSGQFTVGALVISLKNHCDIKKGDIFILCDIRVGACIHHPLVLDIGLGDDRGTHCGVCGATNKGAEWYCARLFAHYGFIKPKTTKQLAKEVRLN